MVQVRPPFWDSCEFCCFPFSWFFASRKRSARAIFLQQSEEFCKIGVFCRFPQVFAEVCRILHASGRFCRMCVSPPAPPSSNHQRVSYFCDALSFLGFLPPLCGFVVRAFLFLMIRRRGAATAQGRPGDHKCYDDLPPYRSPCPVQGTKTKTWRRKPHGRAGISTVHQGSLLWKTKNGEKH